MPPRSAARTGSGRVVLPLCSFPLISAYYLFAMPRVGECQAAKWEEGRMSSNLWRRVAPLMLLVSSGAAAQGNDFVGTWQVDLGVTVSTGTTYSRVDDTTQLRTSTTTIGAGADDLGSLQINADGTYRLRFQEYELIYGTRVIEGAWRPVAANDPFASRGAIELLGAKPDTDYPDDERKWYVFRNDDGSVEARYPPYDGFAKIVLRGGPARAPGSRPEPVARQPAPAATQVARPVAAAGSYTPDQVRAALTGKTIAEIHALLGPPAKVVSGTHSFTGVEKVFPHCASGCNWQSFAIQFGGPGGTASSIELQYWTVE